MTITEALKIVQRAPREAPAFDLVLACGFTPLYLQTFLRAHVQDNLPGRRVGLRVGLYGNLAGTLEALSDSAAHAVSVAVEWPDLDPRLGYRELGSWNATALADILAGTAAMLDRIAVAIERVPIGIAVAVSLPTLPLPPLFHTPGWQAGAAEMELDQQVVAFGVRLARRKGVRVVNSRRLAEDSPPSGRFDLKADLLTGLPYTIPHADCVALSLARLLAPRSPKKGLISDLDDTLWHGLVGEIGPENVAWDLASHHQLHGLYQKLLGALSDQGVLIAIASKNDPAVVERALRREDLLLRPERMFPVEVHWHAKSGSVDRILKTWNIAADTVVFVDDSPMELAEVAAAHPGIECIQFPKGDYAAGYVMLRRLRDVFGKDWISKEDAIRLESIRQGAAFQQVAGAGSAPEDFLDQLKASVTFDFDSPGGDGRVLELVNKTSQFNLNGIRYTEADWQRRLSRPGALLVTVSYQDRFGPLGKIAAIQGCQEGDTLRIGTWVMSCRAFARRIEHLCLKTLFERHRAREIVFDFTPTRRNGPIRDFFAALVGDEPRTDFALKREDFDQRCPPLYQEVSEAESRRPEAHG